MAERDERGRFAKGNKGGPGRPKLETEGKFLRALRRTVKIKDWKHIIQMAIARAKAGDSKARQWLSDYLLGRPAQRVDVTSGGETLSGLSDEERIARIIAIFDAARERRDSGAGD